jgi:hypothetical protein
MSCLRKNEKQAAFLLIGLSSLLIGCSHHQETGRLLATVNSSQLYMKDVAARVDTASAYSVRSYVSNWVNQQLLFEEARRQGLENTQEFQGSVNEYARQLAITMLLNKIVYQAQIDLPQDELLKYYNSHRSDFRAIDEITCVNLAAFAERKLAVSFRNALVSGSSWNDVFNDIPTSAIVDLKDSIYLMSSSVQPAIWDVIQSLEAGKISFPIQVDTVSYVVQVIRKLSAGDSLPFDYAASQIKQRMVIEKRRRLYTLLLDSLRSAGNFQIDPSVAIRDTSVGE